jgi:hypothetical protein
VPTLSPPPYFSADDNVNVTLLLGVASRALMLRMEREKLNNLERKIIKRTCCRKKSGNQPKKGNNTAHFLHQVQIGVYGGDQA